MLGRAYDKGREAGTAEAWELIRLEDQFRPASGKRPGRENFHAEYVRGRFHKRFVPLYRSARGVKVTGLPVVAKDVAERVHAGELDVRRAERMMGSLLLLSAGAPYSRSTYYKRRAELRDNGYVLADDFFTPVEVDLAAYWKLRSRHRSGGRMAKRARALLTVGSGGEAAVVGQCSGMSLDRVLRVSRVVLIG